VNNNVRQLVKAYIKTFDGKTKEAKEAELQSVSGRLELYNRNSHGMTTHYQQAGIIYLRYLRKMEHKKEIQHSDRAHALLSASGASRWLNCTPSPRLEEAFPNESSSFAEEGTLAHELAELRLKWHLELITGRAYELTKEQTIEVSEYYSLDMMDFVDKHIDYVMEEYHSAKRKDKLAVILIEERVDITHIIENGFGTCDVIIIANGIMEVIDLKYGLGVRVDAENNSQLKLYALGALEAYNFLYDVHTVKLTVTQPRMDSISSWEITAEDLMEWGETVVKPTAKIAYEGGGEQKPGDWCRFCKASPRCKAQSDLALEAAKRAFTEPQLLSDDELIEIYAKIPNIEKWFKDVSGYMYKEAMDGKAWEGYKIVDGQARRQWTDEEAVKEVLHGNYKFDEYTNTKVKGIGDIEKLVGKKNFPVMLGELCKAVKTTPSLVPVSDERPAMEKIEYFADDLEDEL
jgi:hypothetical protein